MATITTTETYVLNPYSPPPSSSLRLSSPKPVPEEIHYLDFPLRPIPSTREGPTLSNNLLPPTSTTSNLQTFLTVLQLCTINFLASFTSGIITVGLPTIAHSVSLPRQLYLWPSSVYGLTSGAGLLLAGSIADLVGARLVEVLGCTLLGVFTLSCGFAQTGVQLVVLRAFQGVAVSMHLPSSVALVAAAVPHGKGRNISFGCLGLSQPLGFSFGLVVSGVMIERVGWRSGFYLCGGALLMATVAGMWALPKPPPLAIAAAEDGAEGAGVASSSSVLYRLRHGIDWVGGIIASAGLALLAYILALLSADLSSIHHASTIIMLIISLILLLSFPLWMARRESRHLPALIPNSLWKNLPFTSTCIMVALSYGAMNAMELFSSLYFQEIQSASTLGTSLRLLPNLIVGCCINLSVGFFVDKLPARWLVTGSAILCSCASLMMALVNPKWSYWSMEFWAQMLAPMSGDVLFTVGLLIVSDQFPEKTQALAGAVFNTVAQFGMTFGIGLCQVVSLGVGASDAGGKGDREEGPMLKGYQASFWMMFAFMLVVGVIAVGGLRTAGKLGLKRD